MTSFHYSAYSYLDEWLKQDRYFHDALAFENGDRCISERAREQLVAAAVHYRVVRTLKVQPEEPQRLKYALEALARVQQPRLDNVVETVVAFTEKLAGIYGNRALSAASKFLWMRFRSPIVIYDSVARAELKSVDGDYANYYTVWQDEYHKPECQRGIRDACNALTTIREFTFGHQRPCGANEALLEWVSAEWFMQRVFDHSLLNASEARRYDTAVLARD